LVEHLTALAMLGSEDSGSLPSKEFFPIEQSLSSSVKNIEVFRKRKKPISFKSCYFFQYAEFFHFIDQRMCIGFTFSKRENLKVGSLSYIQFYLTNSDI